MPALSKGMPTRPVRFPQKRIDYEDYSGVNLEDQNQFYDHYAPYTPDNSYTPYTTPKPTVNILAELAKYSKKKNLINRSEGEELYYDPYIKYASPETDMELVMYPAGQLLLNRNNLPSSTTVGPNLQKHLSQYYSNPNSLSSHNADVYQDQSHYESLVNHIPQPQNGIYHSPSIKQGEELFDPALEGDEDPESLASIDREKIEDTSEGLFPKLWRAAKDDLKLVGNVLRFALLE